ncbi:hypothetical protein V5O48_008661 [Marasmius crinis-equi]|uniref:Wings apart-like protein C-terminal domain-containing protein n=1 Tax=Marasmius crinis-equi TaxID=585013 RepID=A0ABR3FDA4_9AGAR
MNDSPRCMSLQQLKFTIQDTLDPVISPRLPIERKIEPLRKLEGLFVQACLRKEKGKFRQDWDENAELDYFLALQATFECNVPCHLLPFISTCNSRLQQIVAEGVDLDTLASDDSPPSLGANEDNCERLRNVSASTDSTVTRDARPCGDKLKQEARYLFQALTLSASLIQALVLNHQASKEWIGRKSGLEVIVDLLLVSRYLSSSSQENTSPSTSSRPETASSSTLTGLVLDTLLCILVPSSFVDGSQPEGDGGVNALRNFEDVQGLQAVVKILKRKGSGRGVRMKCLEFLYFYLLDETSPKFTGLPEVPDIPSLPSSPNKPSFEPSVSAPSPGESTESHSTPSYAVSRNLHSRSQSHVDSSLSTPATPFKKSHIRTSSTHSRSEHKPHSRSARKPFPPLPTNPNTPNTRSDRPPTPISRYGSSTYAFSAGNVGGTFSTSSIPNSRTPSTDSIPADVGVKVPGSRSASSSSAASSAFSVGSDASTAPSSVHSSPRKHSKVLSASEDEDAPTEKEEERRRPLRGTGMGPGGIGLGRPGNSVPGGARAQTPHKPPPPPQPQAYVDYVPATPAPKQRRTADGPSTPVPKLGLGSQFARTPGPGVGVKMKKAGSEGVIGGTPSSSSRPKTKSALALGRASSLGEVGGGERGDEEERERERKKEEAFWEFQAESPQKKSFFSIDVSSDERRPSQHVKLQTRTTKEKTAILGTMLGNVDALVRSLEGVRLG